MTRPSRLPGLSGGGPTPREASPAAPAPCPRPAAGAGDGRLCRSLKFGVTFELPRVGPKLEFDLGLALPDTVKYTLENYNGEGRGRLSGAGKACGEGRCLARAGAWRGRLSGC